MLRENPGVTSCFGNRRITPPRLVRTDSLADLFYKKTGLAVVRRVLAMRHRASLEDRRQQPRPATPPVEGE